MELLKHPVRWLAERLIFFPDRTIDLYPGQWELNFDEVLFTSSDHTKLHAWFLPGGSPNRTLIFAR